jgi:hypothetical protein
VNDEADRQEERVRRIALNEAAFRAVNEQIAPLSESFADLGVDDDVPVVCECGELSCLVQFPIPIEEYRRVRADPVLFVIQPGHERPEAEEVVEEHEGWVVVRKRPGVGEAVARATDPA